MSYYSYRRASGEEVGFSLCGRTVTVEIDGTPVMATDLPPSGNEINVDALNYAAQWQASDQPRLETEMEAAL